MYGKSCKALQVCSQFYKFVERFFGNLCHLLGVISELLRFSNILETFFGNSLGFVKSFVVAA